jgi:RNA polymerase sigma-70 factor (ECF subfamily)
MKSEITNQGLNEPRDRDWFFDVLSECVPSHDFRERCLAAAQSARAHLLREHGLRETREGLPTLVEEALVKLARQGNTAAFGELINLHYDSCLKRASSLIRNPSDAEDEVQNACWKAFERLAQFSGDGTFSAWLGRIVENQCLMRIREDRQARCLYLDESAESNVPVELVAEAPGPEDELGDQQLVNLLQREISRIPPLLRKVMLLSDVERLPMPDVAARLGISVPAAKSRLWRARTELRSRIMKNCGKKAAGPRWQSLLKRFQNG